MTGFGHNNNTDKNKPQQKNQAPKNAFIQKVIDYHIRGDLANAEKGYRAAITCGISNSTIFSNLGIICQVTQRTDEAIAHYIKAIAINPNNPDPYTNLGGLHKDLGNFDQALAFTLKSLRLNPDNPTAHMNLGGIYQKLGQLNQALASTLRSLELNPNNPGAHMNLGSIYKNLGNLNQALASTLKSLELKPDNPTAHSNLGGIYQELGQLNQALAATLISLELQPESSKALYSLGAIQIARGETEAARKNLLNAIKNNPQEYGAYYELSKMLKTAEEARELVKSINLAKSAEVTPQNRSLIEFTISNCLHKAENYADASKHLRLANTNKLIVFPSNIKPLRQAIANSPSGLDPAKTTNFKLDNGKGRIFIVGMPRSGSTLLETILSMNPEIKDLGETGSLQKAIAKAEHQRHNSGDLNINDLYTQFEPFNSAQHKYTTDKQLYNFIYSNWIATHMPAAKIIHCRRNPMDNILSMYRSNLMAGNNYSADLEDAAKVLVAQEQAMQIQKNRHPEKIFTFDYDQFVNKPEPNLRKLLKWLDLEFEYNYLHPEKSSRSINTASSIQAREPINNKSVGGWKNYKNLLKPAKTILQESGIPIE